MWGLLAEAGIPVVTHCGSGPAPGAHTGPEPIGRLLARHPRLKLVVAHMGMPEYGDFLTLAEAYPGVRLDTTMAFTDFTEGFTPFPRTRSSASRIWGTGSCSVPTSRTSRTRTSISCTPWSDWAWGTHGCGRCVTGTRASSSADTCPGGPAARA